MRWLLTSLVGCAACLPTVDFSPPPTCDVADGGLSTPNGRAAVVGAPVTVISSRRSPTCPPSLDVSLQVAVTDDAARAVPAEVRGPFARGHFVTAEITFTPGAPGLHQIDVVFEPGLGRATSQVLAVEAPSLGKRLAAIDASLRCLAEDATPAGSWICLDADSGVSFWRQGSQLQRVPAAGFEVRGDVVWLFARGGVERFIDRGGAVLVREPDALLSLDAELAGASLRAVDPDAVVTVKDETLQVLTVGPAGLERSKPVRLPRGLCSGALELVPRDRDLFMVSCESRPGWLRLCELPAADPQAVRCAEWRGRLVGTAGDGAWLVDGSTLVFRTLSTSASIALPPGWSVGSTRRLSGSFAPLVTDAGGRAFLPRVVGTSVVLRAIAEGLELTGFDEGRLLLTGASTRALWGP